MNDYLARRDSEWMGRLYKFLGLTVGVIHHGIDDEERRRVVSLRHHLRNQQRIRLRLPARQHEVRRRALRPAGLPLCDRRRSRLDPDRRSANAADHFRPKRRIHRQVLPHRQDRSETPARHRLPGRRKTSDRHADRRRRRQGRTTARRRQSLRSLRTWRSCTTSTRD